MTFTRGGELAKCDSLDRFQERNVSKKEEFPSLLGVKLKPRGCSGLN